MIIYPGTHTLSLYLNIMKIVFPFKSPLGERGAKIAGTYVTDESHISFTEFFNPTFFFLENPCLTKCFWKTPSRNITGNNHTNVCRPLTKKKTFGVLLNLNHGKKSFLLRKKVLFFSGTFPTQEKMWSRFVDFCFSCVCVNIFRQVPKKAPINKKDPVKTTAWNNNLVNLDDLSQQSSNYAAYDPRSKKNTKKPQTPSVPVYVWCRSNTPFFFSVLPPSFFFILFFFKLFLFLRKQNVFQVFFFKIENIWFEKPSSFESWTWGSVQKLWGGGLIIPPQTCSPQFSLIFFFGGGW